MLLSERGLGPESCLAICHSRASCIKTGYKIKKLSLLEFLNFGDFNKSVQLLGGKNIEGKGWPLTFYSQTCIRRPPLGPLKSGRLGQVVIL